MNLAPGFIFDSYTESIKHIAEACRGLSERPWPEHLPWQIPPRCINADDLTAVQQEEPFQLSYGH